MCVEKKSITTKQTKKQKKMKAKIVKENLEVLFNQKDGDGNQLVFNLDTNKFQLIKIGERPSHIGELRIIQSGNEELLVYYKHEEETQIHRKTKSWSINRYILSKVDGVIYETDIIRYSISAKKARNVGMTFDWDAPTIDKKVFVPIQYWDKQYKDNKVAPLVNMLGYEWYSEIGDEFNKQYIKEISKRLKEERKKFEILPNQNYVFNVFKQTNFLDIKVVIIGKEPVQSPYANGLAFSIDTENLDAKAPEITNNIFNEVENDIYSGIMLNKDADLTSWAKQGVFLLNHSLTVRKGQPESHKNLGWNFFTQKVIERLNTRKKNLVFMLWGKEIIEYYKPLINSKYHLILEAPYPNENGFYGCEHFSKANEYIGVHYSRRKEIIW